MSTVLGLNYGDEGKGLTTSFLVSQTSNPIVVRFNGGQQAGHTVNFGGKRHVFSNFGSGTLQKAPTYWSKFCTFDPISFFNECNVLTSLEVNIPSFWIDPLCPVTTPFDILANRTGEYILNSTVGAGFGTTLQRQESYYKLFVKDLFYENVVKAKLEGIATYYHINNHDLKEECINSFIEAVREVKHMLNIRDTSILKHFNPIFEGAQGILLDQDHGFFPNVTRSNTTCKNINDIYPRDTNDEVYYVTRTYLTRHGNGYMPNEDKVNLVNNQGETNKDNAFQGNFRIGSLDHDLIKYSLDCDKEFNHICQNKNLVITCMDQHPIDVDYLLSELKFYFDRVFISKGASFDNIEEYKQK